jgi:hypothetical protein
MFCIIRKIWICQKIVLVEEFIDKCIFFLTFLFLNFQNGVNGVHKPCIDNNVKTTDQSSFTKSYENFEDPPIYIAVLTYLSYAILIVFGHFSDFLRRRGWMKVPVAAEPVKPVSRFLLCGSLVT